MKKLFLVSVITTLLIGCHHDDIDGDWTKIDLGNYSYQIWQTDYATVDKDNVNLFAIFPGYGGGYEYNIGNSLKKYLKKTGKQGIIILPYTYYKDSDKMNYTLTMAKQVIREISHERLYLLGFSAGSCQILVMPNDLPETEKIISAGAGAYKAIGGQPSDNLPVPPIQDVWFVEGFEISTYEKYGILYDGTVFVDPVKRLVDSYGYKMTLLPNVDHGGTRDLLSKSTEFYDWLTEEL